MQYGKCLILLVILLIASSCGKSDITPAEQSDLPYPTAAPKQVKTADCGQLDMRDNADKIVRIPRRCITPEFAVEDHAPDAVIPEDELPEIRFDLPVEQQDSLLAYWINTAHNESGGVLLLASATWAPVEAIVGANGSVKIGFADPADAKQTLTYVDDGACAGCAITDIGTYFPNLQKWAEDQGFAGKEQDFFRNYVLTPNTAAFAFKSLEKDYELNGVAYQEHEDNAVVFRKLEIHTEKSAHDLAETILNFFAVWSMQDEKKVKKMD